MLKRIRFDDNCRAIRPADNATHFHLQSGVSGITCFIEDSHPVNCTALKKPLSVTKNHFRIDCWIKAVAHLRPSSGDDEAVNYFWHSSLPFRGILA